MGKFLAIQIPDWNTFKIIDVSDSHFPVEISNITGKGIVNVYIDTEAKLAYASRMIIDIKNPSSPYKLASIAAARDIFVDTKNKIAYTAGTWYGFRILSVENPSRPKVLGFATFPSQSWGIYVDTNESVAYFCDTLKFMIIDVSNPFSPTVISYVRMAEPREVEVDHKEKIAYIAARQAGLQIVDVSDIYSPKVIGSYIPPRTGAFQSGYCRDLVVDTKEKIAYLACSDYVRIVDISNFTNPVELSNYSMGYTRGIDVDLNDNLAYVADAYPARVYPKREGKRGLKIIDVSNLSNPKEIGYYDTGQSFKVHIDKNDKIAYISNYDRRYDNYYNLWIINISDPAHPSKMGTYSSNYRISDFYLDSKEKIAYINLPAGRIPSWTSYFSSKKKPYPKGGIRIIDCSDPSSPKEIGYYDSYEVPGFQGIFVDTNSKIIYLAAGDNGLRIISLRNYYPSEPSVNFGKEEIRR